MKWFSSVGDLKKPEKYHLVLWKYLGLIPPQEPGYKRHMYLIVSVIMNTLTFCCPLSMIIYMLKVDNFPKFCECAFLGSAFTGVSVKFASTIFILPKLNLVTDSAERLIQRAKNNDELHCLNEGLRKGHNIFKTIAIIFFSGYIATILVSFANVFASVPALNTPAWYPFDWENNRIIFEICTIYQIISMTFQTFQAIASDTYVIVYIKYLIGHINALAVRAQKIGEHPEKDSEDNYLDLTDCIQDHQNIIR